MQKVEFKVKVNDEEKTFVVRMPSGQLRKKARELKLDFFRENAFKEGVIFSHQILELLKRRGLWTEAKDEEIRTVSKEIDEKVRKLSRGKSDEVPTKDVLRSKIINEIKPLRNRQLELLAERSQLDNLSLESESQQKEMDYLVSESVFTDMDDKVYSSIGDYYDKSDEPYTEEAGRKLAELIGLTNPKWWADLPENKLLLKYKMINEDGQYINQDGELVNADNKRINSDGFLINENNEIVDEFGNRIDKDGNVLDVVDFD